MDDQANDHLLRLLDAHGQKFLAKFPLPKKRKAIDDSDDRATKSPRTYDSGSEFLGDEYASNDFEEEWYGVREDDSDGVFQSDDEYDDEFAASTHTEAAPVVVFTDHRSKLERPLNSGKKVFMSSKVSRIRDESEFVERRKQEAGTEDDDENDTRNNVRNDALLHTLIHTKLLSGSLNPELNLSPAERRKALAGRVLELSGGARLGKGEKMVRIAERNKAAKRVREGIVEKQKSRDKARLEEAKNLGNYHPSIKQLFKGDDDSKHSRKRRERGLKLSAGKFSGGILTLRERDISAIRGTHGRGRGRRNRMGRKDATQNS